IEAALTIAREEGVAVTARGGGTSQAGQTINETLILDTSTHLNRILDVDLEEMRARVEPGVVLDQLNKALRPHGVWFPIDISTASRCTIGGMAANNSCGARTIRYGNLVHNTRGIRAALADGETCRRAMRTWYSGCAPWPAGSGTKSGGAGLSSCAMSRATI